MPPKRTSSKYSTIETMGTEMKINIPKERKKREPSSTTPEEQNVSVVQGIPTKHEKTPSVPKPRTRKRFSTSWSLDSPPQSDKTEQKSVNKLRLNESKPKPKEKPAHLVKGSEAARQRMSELRAMRGKNKNQTS